MPVRVVRRTLRWVGALSLALTTSGCGFFLTTAPPVGHERLNYFTCTESDTGPVLDVIWGALNFAGAAAVATDPDPYYDTDRTILVGLAWAAISGASALSGFKKTRECRSAMQQLAARSGPPAAPGPPDAGQMIQEVVIVAPSLEIAVGDRIQLTATAYESSGASVRGRLFLWSSSNDAIASVNGAGLVTAHAAGSVVVAARVGNAVGTIRLTVGPGESPESTLP